MNISQKEEFRYWFAGMALQAMVSNPTAEVNEMLIDEEMEALDIEYIPAIASLARCYANALIAELDKKEVKYDNPA